MVGATWNWCHLCMFCVHHTTLHHVTSCKATYVIAPTTHVLTLPNYNPLAQTAASHLLLDIPPFFTSISSHCVLCLFACLLTLSPNGHWIEWVEVLCSLTMGNPKSVSSVCPLPKLGLSGCVSLAKIVLSLSLIDGKLCPCFLAFSPSLHLPSWCSCWVWFCLVSMQVVRSKVRLGCAKMARACRNFVTCTLASIPRPCFRCYLGDETLRLFMGMVHSPSFPGNNFHVMSFSATTRARSLLPWWWGLMIIHGNGPLTQFSWQKSYCWSFLSHYQSEIFQTLQWCWFWPVWPIFKVTVVLEKIKWELYLLNNFYFSVHSVLLSHNGQ